MSDYEHHRGRLIKVDKIGYETLENQLFRIFEGVDLVKYGYETYEEYIRYEMSREFVIYNHTLYKIESKEVDPYDDIIRAEKTEYGTINFELRYYNGGCGFSEALEEALNKLE